MDSYGFTAIKEKKNLLDKLKKVCSMMAKFNLNSPCLLQIVNINGNYEVILSYDPKNGDNFNFYKIFNVVLFDNFVINEDDIKYFDKTDDRVSIPVIVSSFPIAENNSTTNINPVVFYSSKSYSMSEDSYYVFPKFVLEALKAEVIEDFETRPISQENNIYTFNFNIKTKDNPRFNNILFIHNQDKLENIFRLSVLPFHIPTQIKDLYMKIYLNSANSKLVVSPEVWKENYEKYGDYNSFKLQGFNGQDFVIYHNDFFQSKIAYCHAAKYYEERDGTSNVASVYFAIGYSGNVHVYMKYKYYDI